ncbi:ATP-binding cassette domain-containing protein [Agriterribacter sp.]|uniref:ABC transporter ATP-binding protein n=1 Tax=Agriterribacter sp. TaxID=2821509 RepID=UPI002CF05062|nr:ATP-binding cassette domain-containing protein [Agriterribacter sp.]HRO47375.1 ATP-binding cassette domain-containing protein [Agriterribacter sp.]HRQ18802.1 ATP-binding cassette domain-containing protein [Agriterribacter sp.]
MHTTENKERPAQNAEQGKAVMAVRNLYKSFGSHKVLIDFSVSLHSGENVVVLGKSGSGKSVLIKCIIGLLKPDSGAIEVLGESIPDLNDEALDAIRMKIGFLFQSNALYDSMTVRENLEFPLRRHSITLMHEDVDQLVKDALEDVKLAHTIDMMPAELSGGMRKRIALARTLILKPAIILYDEPTTGLDPITSREIIDLIKEVQQKYHAASLIISHDMNCVRMVADRVVMLIDGRNYREGTYAELIQSEDPAIKAFFE